MMPGRKCLAEGIFDVADLRSPSGIQVIYDIIKLCEQEREVEFRPGLEPDKCCCRSNNNEDDESKLSLQKIILDSYDWRHIYSCYQAA